MNGFHRTLTAGILCSGFFVAAGAIAQTGTSPNSCPCLQQNVHRNTAGSTPTSRPGMVGNPSPESLTSPVARVTPENGTVDIKLNNTTNALISYQVIGHTSPRVLAGGTEETLRNLPLPVTITLTRQDNGLLRVLPIESADAPTGTLEVNLDEKIRFDDVQGTIRIQRNGGVYVY